MRRCLTGCAGAAFVALIAAAGLLLVGVPALVQYLARYDTQPLFDLQGLGQRQTIGAYDVILTAVTASPCASNATCQQAVVTFEVLMPGAAADSGTVYRVSWQADQTASDMITLGDGTALRVVAVQAQMGVRAGELSYRVRFQAFLPPD